MSVRIRRAGNAAPGTERATARRSAGRDRSVRAAISGRRRRIGVAGLLLALVLAALLPALGLGLAATWYALSEQRAAAEIRLDDITRDIALAVDRQLTGYVDAMIAFTSSPAFADPAAPDVPALYRQAQRMAGQLGVTIGLLRPDGSRVFNTQRPLGTPMPPVNAIDLIRRVAATGRPAISNLVSGSVSHRLVISLVAPVFDAAGRVVLVANFVVTVETLLDLLRQAGLPSRGFSSIVDADGVILARSDDPRNQTAGKSITPEGLRILRGNRSRGSYYARRREGPVNLYHFQKLQSAPGWGVFVGQPVTTIDTFWHPPTLIFGFGTVAILLLGTGLAFVAARPILEPLRRLARHARIVAASGGDAAAIAATAATLPRMVVAELETLRQGFSAAEATLLLRADAERRAGMQAAQREAQIHALFQASPIGLGRVAADGRIAEANDILLSILGVDRDALQSTPLLWDEVTAAESARIAEGAVGQAEEEPGRPSAAHETDILRRNGVRVPVLVSFADLPADEAAVFVLDLTDTRLNQARLRDLVSTLDLGAFMTRALDGTLRHWSAGCERIYGWTAAEAVGRNVHDLLQTRFPVPVPELEAELMASGEWTGELRQVGKDGRPIELTAYKRLYRDADGQRLLLEMVTDVTAQRRAETALAESQARLAAISEASPDLIYSKDRDGHILYANAAVASAFGVAGPELLGKHARDVYRDPADAERCLLNDRQVIESGMPAMFEERFPRADGETRAYVSVRAPLRQPDTGVITGVAVVSHDVTGQRETEARLAAIVASTLDAIICFAPSNGHIMSWNRGAEALFGYAEAEAVGQPFTLLWPDSRPDGEPTSLLRSILAGAVIRDHETVRRTKSGVEIPVAVTAVRLQSPDGTIIGISGTFRDLRPRLQAENALREGEARWRALADSHPGFVFEADEAGRFTYTNANFQRFAGVAAELLLGDGWLDALHPDDRGRAAASWSEASRLGATLEAEFRFRSAAGSEAWYLFRSVPQRDARRKVLRWCGACTDISAIVAARDSAAHSAAALERLVDARTRELEATQERLAHAAKMEALGRLAGGVAHDFNNVLQAVQGALVLAGKRLRSNPERVASYLAMGMDAADRGAAVTGRLLAFAHRSELSATPIEPAPLLRGLADMLSHTLGPSVQLDVATADGLPPLLADKAQLETVIVNLANNARDALPEGTGTIRLAADMPGAAPARLPSGRFIRISVTDNGSGMAPAVLARVSEPFFTTKPRGAGTGLGLAMARGFAERSGGTLVIQSKVDEGTDVSLWLPAALVESDAAVGDRGPAAQPAIAPQKILVVDDEPVVRGVLTNLLVDLGHATLEAGDGASALELFAAGLQVDMLLTDLAMPGHLNGLALICEARRRRPGLPALLLTGHTGNANRLALEEAAAGGPFLMLHKPITAAALEAKLETLLGA